MEERGELAVVGLGYVGLPLALLADKKGHRVTGIDIDEGKIGLLRRGRSPFAEQVADQEVAGSGAWFTSDFERVHRAGIVIICVPTPVDSERQPDLRPVRRAAAAVAAHLRPGQLVILESTVNPGVCESVVLPELESGSGLVGGRDFHLAHCPERINPGDRSWNVANIPRVVGSLDTAGLERALAFYRSIITGEVRAMESLKEAEAVKVVENSFRDINIAFVNELAMSFDRLGINVINVIDGAATKPFAFMPHYPGAGVGGHCIPVDPYYLIEYARENGFDHEFLSLARRINRKMPRYTAELTAELLAQAGVDITNSRVAILGLAYKADIADTRESPAYEIATELRAMGAEVVSYDPFVTSSQAGPVAAPKMAAVGAARPDEPALYEKINPAHRPLARAIEGADALVVATGHRVFREAAPALFAGAGVKAIVDGRNCLDRSLIEPLGILYKGIGQ